MRTDRPRSTQSPPAGEAPVAEDSATVAKTDTPPAETAPEPTSSIPEPTSEQPPSLDSAPYAETHEPDGWTQPAGRPPLGELAEQSASKEN